jgi:cytochrome P450
MIEAPDTDDPAVLAQAGELWRFLDRHLRDRVEHPRDDLTSMLVHAEFAGRPLTHAEARMFCLSLLVAGNETTRHLLSGMLVALAEHPDQRAALAADPSLVPAAVEEGLRWVTPIQAFGRTTVQATHIGGEPVPADAFVIMLYASANRDESAFGPTAHAFDVTRPVDPPHLSFGFGEHLCLGAALARMEARVFLTELLARTPDWEVTGAGEWTRSTLVRGMRSLPIRAPRERTGPVGPRR